MNNYIEGGQCKILWHVGNIKTSHKDSKVVTTIIDLISSVYVREYQLTATHGKVHEYLGMTIDFSDKDKLKFTMYDCIVNMLEELPEDMKTGEAATPAGDHMFTINEDNPEKLNQEDTIMFHRVTAKMLYLAKRSRPDLQLGVNFLCTRMKEPDKDDCKKLTRVMRYIRSTTGLPLILGIDDTNMLCWYIDAVFGVHRDMKSHTIMMMTMGQGASRSNSTKHKLNTKSSIKAELLGIDDEISLIIWSGYFLSEQGYQVRDNICYQDS